MGSSNSIISLSGVLGNASLTSVAPPEDNYAGSPVSPTSDTINPTFTADGTINLESKDLAWEAMLEAKDAGVIHINALNSDTYVLANDYLNFSDADNYVSNYKVYGNSGNSGYQFNAFNPSFDSAASAGKASFTFSEAHMLLPGLDDGQYKEITINYTPNNEDSKTLYIDLTNGGQQTLSTGAQVKDYINAYLGVTTTDTITPNYIFKSIANHVANNAGDHAGFKAGIVTDNASLLAPNTLIIGNYNAVQIDSVTCVSGPRPGASGSTINLQVNINNNYADSLEFLDFKGDGSTYLPGNSNAHLEYFSPNFLHASKLYNIANTNLDRYKIHEQGGNSSVYESNHFVLSGANDKNFVKLDAGIRDTDTLSFFVPNSESTVAGDPTADADYNLLGTDSTGVTAYTKINNIEIIDAAGYGTNNIQLNQTAVKFITEEKSSNTWALSIKGDAVDTVTLSDEANWQYSGIIDMGTHLNPSENSAVLVEAEATKTQYGNILYQYTYNTSPQTYLYISASIGTHPDWYYTGTTSNDSLELPDTQFGSVNFGDGTDTLEMHSGLSAKTQDFTGEGGDLANVEIINFTNTYYTSYDSYDSNVNYTNDDIGKATGAGINTAVSVDNIIVDKTFVGAATDSNNILSLIGDNEDNVTITNVSTEWTFMGEVVEKGDLSAYDFYQYKTDSGIVLNIEQEMTDNTGIYYNGWAGDDLIEPFSATYDGIDGGAGTDSLGFNEATQNYASTLSNISNIEVIDGRTHSGATTITIDKTSAGSMTDSNNTLYIIGDASDIVAFSDESTNWTYVTSIDASTSNNSLKDFSYNQYQSVTGGITVNIQSTLNHPGIFYHGGSEDNKYTVSSLASFSFMKGGDGTDWLQVSSDDYNFTATSTTAISATATMDDMEVIDSRGDAGTNVVTLNQAAITAISDSNNIITLFGDASDSVALADLASNWSWVGKVNGGLDFTGMQFYQYQSLDGTATLNVHDTITTRPAVYAIGDIGNSQRDDVLLLENMNFAKVDGKLGTDTLVVDDSANVGTLDFSAVTTVANIEVIDISDTASGVTTSASSIKVSEDFVYNGTDADNGLLLLGDSGDSLSFLDASQWSYAGYLAAGGDWPAIHAYQATSNSQTVTLYADTDFGGPMVDAKGSTSNDVINVKDKEDVNIDGQSGFDTLTTSGDTAAIDLTSGKTVQGIDLINITNSSAETLTFNAAAVDASDNDTIYVQGDSTDTVNGSSGDNWVLTGRANFDNAPDMYVYQADNSGNTVSLYVQTDLLQSSLYQTSGGSNADDILKVKDTAFGSMDGSSGFDRLLFLQQGDVDLSNLAGGNTLSSIEAIDTTNGVSNSLTVDADLVAQINSGNDLYVMGDSSDSLNLSGWTAGGSTVMNANLTWNSYTSTASGGETVTVYADSQVTATT